jgi:hypothetical protein
MLKLFRRFGEHFSRQFEGGNKAYNKFQSEVGDMTGDWRKLHNEELHNLYSSPSIIKVIKSRRMRWTGHVARMGRRRMLIGYW